MSNPAGTALAISADEELAPRLWQEVANYLDEKMFELKHANRAADFPRSVPRSLSTIWQPSPMKSSLQAWSVGQIRTGAIIWYGLRYFRSQISGLMIFSRIDDLLKRRDSGDDELCAIYLMLLSLCNGFKENYTKKSGGEW